MKIHSKSRGFTLIELMVVCAIIGILSAMVIVSLASAKAKARDGKRVSDLAQIQGALEQYFDHNNAYPTTLNSINNSGTVYISTMPTAPVGGSCVSSYGYDINDNNKPTDYVLQTCLENNNAAIQDGLSSDPYAGNLNCASNSTASTYNYCVGPK